MLRIASRAHSPRSRLFRVRRPGSRQLADRLLTPESVGRLLEGLMKRQAAKDEDHSSRLTALRAKLADAEKRLGRLCSGPRL
jgi:site-specific DNA recombinase